MAGKHRVNDVALTLGVSQTTIYKSFARMKDQLTGHFRKEKGVLIFDDEALLKFRESISTADQSSVPVVQVPSVQVAPSQVDLSPVSNRLEQIERAILCQIEQGNALIRENRELRAELAAIRAENSAIRKLLTAPATEKANEKSFADELESAVREIKSFITGSLSPFASWLKLG